ncbi:Uncharacterised protein [Serratia odorifera]|uniref:Uncharacterized protein n=1 Tax=Serratia odorifera TaxID=618 RepID=A0A3S4DPG4_SEROD|nr:Uncharacterised protein [Serratia odorifera]
MQIGTLLRLAKVILPQEIKIRRLSMQQPLIRRGETPRMRG